MKVKNCVVAITGAAGGLGSAMARRLTAGGARLALLDRAGAPLEDLVSALGGDAGRYLVRTCDVTDESSVDGAMAAVREHFGRFDVVVNNAGITADGLLIKYRDGELLSRMSLDHWRRVIDVNLTGVFLCGRAAAEQMARAGHGGLIVNISSISRHGNRGQTNYSASKAGVQAMTVTWAKELARLGIRAVSISPGFIHTDMVEAMKPEALAKLQGEIPSGRLGAPDEIAATVEFIIENEFVNGRDIGVDGAMRL